MTGEGTFPNVKREIQLQLDVAPCLSKGSLDMVAWGEHRSPGRGLDGGQGENTEALAEDLMEGRGRTRKHWLRTWWRNGDNPDPWQRTWWRAWGEPGALAKITVQEHISLKYCVLIIGL